MSKSWQRRITAEKYELSRCKDIDESFAVRMPHLRPNAVITGLLRSHAVEIRMDDMYAVWMSTYLLWINDTTE